MEDLQDLWCEARGSNDRKKLEWAEYFIDEIRALQIEKVDQATSTATFTKFVLKLRVVHSCWREGPNGIVQ